MTRVMLAVVLTLLLISSVNLIDCLIQDGLGRFLSSLGTVKQVKIPDLLNLVCNDSQGSNATRRDACYGCFYRTSVLPQGFSMLVGMSACADSYLNNTGYGHCQAYLRNTTSTPSTRSPRLIYCSFLECLRQVNKDTLIIDPRGGPSRLFFGQRTLRGCVREAARMFPNSDNVYVNYTETQLAQLFVNTTACVLAKTRCSYMNPVTGEVQDDDIGYKLRLPSFNAILVNADYDINIVQLPFRYGSADVCTKYRNVQQATWPSVAC